MDSRRTSWRCSRRSFRSGLEGAAALCWLALAAIGAQAGWENGDWALLYDTQSAANDVCSCPDGQGGMFVATVDPGAILPIQITRVDHAGAERWGDGGRGIPWSVGASAMTGPLDVAPDGNGGAYLAYREIWGSQHIVTVRHLHGTGELDWRTYVADAGDPGTWAVLHFELQSTGDGEVILAWTNAVMGDGKVKLARLTAGGAIQWQTETPSGLLITYDRPHWGLEPDGGGGVLLACRQAPSGYPLWTWVQRIDGAGQKQWGVNGVQLATWVTDLCPIQGDGSGGAFVAMHDGVAGVTRAQHLAWSGVELWPSEGLVVLPYGASRPCLCGDANNGVYVVESAALDVHAQRVDWYGNLLWGTSGIVVAGHAGEQKLDSAVADGFGGFIAGYTDYYFVAYNGGPNRVPSGVRMNGFGWKVWEAIGLWMVGYDDGQEPRGVMAIADGSGGAQFNWREYWTPTTDRKVYGVGVGPTGGEPKPIVAYMWPPSGTPEETLSVLVLGDYLEASQSFQLQRTGAPSIPITSPILLTNQAVWGGLDLATAVYGPYDLSVSAGGVPADTLADAFGVGEPPPCGDDEMFVGGGQAVGMTSGSQRKAAFDSQGRMWMAWLQQGASLALEVKEWRGESNGVESVWTLYSGSDRPWDLSFAIGPDDVHHIVYVAVRGGQRYLEYLRGPGGTGYSSSERFMPDGIENPVVAALPGGAACIVYESEVGGVRSLYYLNASVSSGLQGPYSLNAGTNATRPDLVAYNGDLMLTFVRDFWLPGNREVCYQRRTAGTWGDPIGIYFGVNVWSPSVAADGADGFLFAFCLDNTGTDPLLHTCRMEDGALDPVRWWYTDGILHSTSVCGNGPGSYYLMSEETVSGNPMNIYLRATNGTVLYPQKKLNTSQVIDLPFFTARYGSQAYGAWWEEYDENLFPLHRAICFAAGPSSVEIEVAVAVELSLTASPNPAAGGATFAYTLPSAAWVRLELFDVTGRRVRMLADGMVAPGAHEAAWNARDERGAPLSPGVYFARLRLGNGQDRVTKLTLVR